MLSLNAEPRTDDVENTGTGIEGAAEHRVEEPREPDTERR